MYIVTRQLCGKWFSQVRNSYSNGGNTVYETPEYLTKDMADADAKCWLVFYGKEDNMEINGQNYDVEETDRVYSYGRETMTGTEFAALVSKWADKNPTFRVEPTQQGFRLHVKFGKSRTTHRYLIVKHGKFLRP